MMLCLLGEVDSLRSANADWLVLLPNQLNDSFVCFLVLHEFSVSIYHTLHQFQIGGIRIDEPVRSWWSYEPSRKKRRLNRTCTTATKRRVEQSTQWKGVGTAHATIAGLALATGTKQSVITTSAVFRGTITRDTERSVVLRGTRCSRADSHLREEAIHKGLWAYGPRGSHPTPEVHSV